MWRVKLLYLFLAGISYLFFLLYLPTFSAYLLVLILIFPIVLFLAAHWSGLRLTYEIQLPQSPAALQESFSAALLLQNHTWLPIGNVKTVVHISHLTLSQENEMTYCTTVSAKGTAKITFPVVPEHYGQMLFEIRQVRIFDFIRLFSHGKRKTVSARLVVLPKIPVPPLPEALYLFDEKKNNPVRPTESPEDFLGIRAYRPGDRMRAIHWKLSSRLPEPVVVEYGVPVQTPVVVGMVFAFSPHRPEFENRLDAMLEAILAFAAAICQESDMMTFLLYRSGKTVQHMITSPYALLPILIALLETAPDTSPLHGWENLQQEADAISFCIADSLPERLGKTKGLVTDISAAGLEQLQLVPHHAAETVFRQLQKTNQEDVR